MSELLRVHWKLVGQALWKLACICGFTCSLRSSIVTGFRISCIHMHLIYMIGGRAGCLYTHLTYVRASTYSTQYKVCSAVSCCDQCSVSTSHVAALMSAAKLGVPCNNTATVKTLQQPKHNHGAIAGEPQLLSAQDEQRQYVKDKQ